MHELGVSDPHLERILHAALLLRANGSGEARRTAVSGASARAEVPTPRRQPEATAARDVLPRRASGRAPRRGARAGSRN
jgi:hypothetical protein